LSFKDLHLFNQAMLAGQAWRLIEYPNSLCARVLKGKYFPNGELVDMTFPKQVSPTWRVIEHGLDLVKKVNHMAYWLGEESQHMEGPMIVALAVFQNQYEEGPKLIAMGFTADALG
jgi:hypothetical protein